MSLVLPAVIKSESENESESESENDKERNKNGLVIDLYSNWFRVADNLPDSFTDRAKLTLTKSFYRLGHCVHT